MTLPWSLREERLTRNWWTRLPTAKLRAPTGRDWPKFSSRRRRGKPRLGEEGEAFGRDHDDEDDDYQHDGQWRETRNIDRPWRHPQLRPQTETGADWDEEGE